MKVLKHIAGILLAAFGILFVLGAVAWGVKPDSDIPRWFAIPACLVLGVLPLWAGYMLLRKYLFVQETPCPKCGSSQRVQAVLTRGPSLWLFLTCGAVVSALWGASRKQQARCKDCETAYSYDTRGSRIAGVCFWILILFVLCGCLIGALEQR
jgi:drug/metabolite transporter (DMT)-like permease